MAMIITASRIRTIMTMIIDAAQLLRLQSWFSPAFPIGAFSYSHGLEWAVEDGSVTDRTSLVAWLEADLRHGSGRMDAMFFAQAWRVTGALSPSPGMLTHSGRAFVATQSFSQRPEPGGATSIAGLPASAQAQPGHAAETAPSDILAIAALAAAMRGTAELALESGQQGIAFLAAVRKAWPHPQLDRLANHLTQSGIAPVLPIAAGICCAAHHIGLDLALPFYMHGSAANLVNAAVRLVPLGQTDGQIALAALEAAVLETACEAAQAELADIGSAAVMIDLACMCHETQYTRLFRS
jgi:urease accessory protein